MSKPRAFNAAAADSAAEAAARRNYIAVSATVGLPSSSWWLEAGTREEFAALARREWRRMQESTFAKSNKLTTGRDTERVEKID